MEVKDANALLNEDLETLERKIMLIGTADRERFKEFMSRLKVIQNSTIGMSKSEFDTAKFSIIDDLTKLQVDFDSYMDGSEMNDTMTKQVSGKSKIKTHKIGLYISIVEDFKKLDEIDIEKLRSLRQKWDEEKQDDYLDYQPIEQSIVEEALSDAFLEYQIKHIQTYGSLPQEKLQEFTTPEEYKLSIREKLLELSDKDDVDAKTKLDIEKYLLEENLETLLKDENFFKVLTQKDKVDTEKNVDKVLEDKKTQKEEQSNLPAVIPEEKTKHQYLYCTIKKKGLFGKEKEKTIKVKIKDGSTYLPGKYKDKIISVVIPEGIEKLTNYSFTNCINLEKVSLPSTLTEIGFQAFQGCMSLTDIEFPERLSKIEREAFLNCENLENINLHSGITILGDYAFQNTGIREIDLTKGDSENLGSKLEIGIGTFSGCKKLEKVKLSERLAFIPDQLFNGCIALKEVKFAKGLRGIGEEAFKNCSLISEMMDIPETVTEIGRACFEGCANLTKFKMPTFLKYMGKAVFDHEKIFQRFVLPKQLMNVQILENLNTNEETEMEMPEDAKGYLYEKLGLKAGDKIKYNELKLMIADKSAQEKVMEVERIRKSKMTRVGNSYRYNVSYETPTVKITSVKPQEDIEEPEV